MKSLLIDIVLLFPILTIGQTNSKTASGLIKIGPKLYVEQVPSYPGGDEALMKYIMTNLIYPEKAKQEMIQGTVFVTFVVKADGRISNIKVIRGIGYGCDEEAIRLFQTMPNWKPAMRNGEYQDVQMNFPVRFHLIK